MQADVLQQCMSTGGGWARWGGKDLLYRCNKRWLQKNVNQWCIDWTYWTIAKRPIYHHATAGRWNAKSKNVMGLEMPEQKKLWSSLRLDLRQMLDSPFIALQWVFNKRWARFIKTGHPKPWIPCGFSPRTGGMHKIIKSILWGRRKGWKDVNIECNLFSCLLESSSCFINNPVEAAKKLSIKAYF